MTVTNLSSLLFSEFKSPAYLSGPMTGYHDMNRAQFDAAKEFIEKTFGITVLSPHLVATPCENPSWVDWMKADIALLMKCNMVIVMKYWEMSRGCRLEVDIAHRLGLLVVPHELLYTSTLA